jgi:hypothetical protein
MLTPDLPGFHRSSGSQCANQKTGSRVITENRILHVKRLTVKPPNALHARQIFTRHLHRSHRRTGTSESGYLCSRPTIKLVPTNSAPLVAKKLPTVLQIRIAPPRNCLLNDIDACGAAALKVAPLLQLPKSRRPTKDARRKLPFARQSCQISFVNFS